MATNAKSLNEYAHTDPEVASCPFPYYAAMRREEPIHCDPGTGFYWVSRYEDIVSVALDPETYSSQVNLIIKTKFRPAAEKVLADAGVTVMHTFVTSDPPEALDIHRLANQLFPPKSVNAIKPHLEELCNALVDRFIDRGEVDVIREFSTRLIGTVIGEQLGLPLADLHLFQEWAECTAELMKIGISEDWEAHNVAKMVDLVRYLTPHLERAARDGAPGTAIHTLATMNKRDGSPFSSDERCWMTFRTFTGGHATTINMLNTDLMTLAMDQELQARLRADPMLVDNFVEEMLRLQGSAQNLARRTTRDVTLNGTVLPKGSILLLSLGSGNRDELFWGNEADKLKLDRSNCKHHLTFGNGLHACAGRHLARAELRTSIRTFLERMKHFQLKDPSNPPAFLPLPFFRAIGELNLVFEVA